MSESTPPRHPETYSRAALITGAGKRIGLTIARALASDGWAVALHYRSSGDEADTAARQIRSAGGRAVTLRADLSLESESESLVPRAVDELGPLGCLVNNAASFELDLAETATRETWDAHVAPNLRAPFVLSQAFARALPAAFAISSTSSVT